MRGGSDPKPELTFEPLASPTIESAGFVRFRVTATRDYGSNFVVRFDPSEDSGDFLDENASLTLDSQTGKSISLDQEAITLQGISFIRLGNNSYQAFLRVPIHDDSVSERTGTIQVELLDGDDTTEAYTVNTARENKRIQKATILDDDAPELSIQPVSSTLEVIEASNAELVFPVRTAVSPNDSITVFYTVSQATIQSDGSTLPNGDFIAPLQGNQNRSQTLDFSGNKTSANLSIPIVNDDVKEKGVQLLV